MAGEKSEKEKPFRFLSAEEYAALSIEERADYLRRANEAIQSKRKPKDEPKKPPGGPKER